MSTEPIAHDAGGRPIYAGAIVNICTDVAHLYDESGVSNGWVVEGLGGVGIESMYPLARKATPEALRRAAQDAVIRLRDKATGNWVFAPSLWVTLASAGAPLGTPPPNDLRELALVLFEKRNHSATDVIVALKVWGADYVMRTNPPRTDSAPGDPPEQTFLRELSIKFGYANIGCVPTQQSVRGAIDTVLDALASAQRYRKEAEDRAAELEVKYHELKDRVDNAVKSFGGG